MKTLFLAALLSAGALPVSAAPMHPSRGRGGSGNAEFSGCDFKTWDAAQKCLSTIKLEVSNKHAAADKARRDLQAKETQMSGDPVGKASEVRELQDKSDSAHNTYLIWKKRYTECAEKVSAWAKANGTDEQKRKAADAVLSGSGL